MKMAYLILADHSAQQLEKLVTALSRPDDVFLIHVDDRQPSLYAQVEGLLGQRQDVRLITRRFKTWPGHINHVRAARELMAKLVETKQAYDYALLLSDWDAPIKPAEALKSFLEENSGRHFLNYSRVDEGKSIWADWGPPTNARSRLEHLHLVFHSRLIKRIPMKRSLPCGHDAYIGYPWWTLTREAVEYAVTFLQEHPQYERFHRFVFMPDEVFWQNVFLNSPLRDSFVDDNLRYIHPQPFPNHNEPVTAEHLQALSESDAFFARRFDESAHPGVFDAIVEGLASKPPTL